MPTLLPRRTTLAAAFLAGAPLAGCSLRPTPPAAAPAPANPDQALVDALATRIAALLPVSPPPWHDLHLAQLAALGRPGPRAVAGRHAVDLAAERRLLETIVGDAVAARTPALARLLTAMAAGQAQYLAAR